MADKKISQLTSTTSANDNVWLVMNDSGDTQTFKIKRSDLLSGTTTPPGLVAGTGTNSIKSNLTSTPATASGDDSIAIGRNTIATTQAVAIGGTTNVNGGGSVGVGYGLSNFGAFSVQVGNGISSNGSEANIGIGRDVAVSNGSVAIGNNQYAGQAVRATGAQCVSIGQGIQQNQANYGTIVGRGLKINNSSAVESFIYGGRDNTITTSNGRNGIIGGVGNTLTGTTSGTTLINLQGFTSPALDNTTYVDNIHTLRAESFNVIAGGNVGGTVNVDCSLGTIFTFTMTADTTPNFINLRTGQRFIFIVDNTTFNVPDAQINGVSGNVYAKNGTISPSNNAVSKYTATYDGTRLFLDEELNFSAV